MLFGIAWSIGALWWAAALALVIAEMLVPGFFLVFLGAGAAVTGLLVLIAPDVPIVLQALVFAGLTAGAVAIGRRWYRGLASTASEPALNDRAARLIGRRVLVCEAIVDGEGRVTVGDGAWTAIGPDAAVGASVRIVGADGSVLRVELG
ncbi:NfeD family protein [Sphingomonas sp. PAMC 26605]|uniref:NfeD family protein n=1 Tax=Sphingomonas sp. PAMC 26605 TaxID=1112214 RepID=UPI00026CD74A|nr:NfeD family protein [Sphingomonas sp. PAMC 26605]